MRCLGQIYHSLGFRPNILSMIVWEKFLTDFWSIFNHFTKKAMFSQKHTKICIISWNSANLTKMWQISDKKNSQTIMDKIYWRKAINCQNFQKHAFWYHPMQNFHLEMTKFQWKSTFWIYLKDFLSVFLVFIWFSGQIRP